MLPTVISSLLVTLMLLCALQAVRAGQLLTAALWLAGVSAAASSLLFVMGAFEIAVIELSLSMGLVTVLLVFAISMIGANSPDVRVVKPAYWPLLVVFVLLIISLILLGQPPELTASPVDFTTALWSFRQLDVILQIALIFVGVLSVLFLLSGLRSPAPPEIMTAHEPIDESVVEEMHQ